MVRSICLVVLLILLSTFQVAGQVDYAIKIKGGQSSFETTGIEEISKEIRSSPGRTYYEFRDMRFEQGFFGSVELEGQWKRIVVGTGFGYCQNSISYDEGYDPVGLAVDTLPNLITNTFRLSDLTHSFKVGYRVGNRLTVTPYVGLINTRFSNMRWRRGTSSNKLPHYFTQQFWEASASLELELAYQLTDHISFGASMLAAQGIRNRDKIQEELIGVQAVVYDDYRRIGAVGHVTIKLSGLKWMQQINHFLSKSSSSSVTQLLM
jgi:hypothetical protein